MFTQQITTSKYKTTIDIPIHKLQTKCSFLQIPKQSSQGYNQTIQIPSCHCNQKLQQYRRKHQYQTRQLIQQLQTAYQDDMKQYQQKLSLLKYEKDILKLQSDNKIQNLMKQIQLLKDKIKQKDKIQFINNQTVIRLESQIKNKNIYVQQLQNQIKSLNNKITQLQQQNKQKAVLLTTKLNDFKLNQHQKHQKYILQLKHQYQSKYNIYEQKISKLSFQNNNLSLQLSKLKQRLLTQQLNNKTLIHQIQTLKQQKIKLRQQIQFQSKQIQSYLNKIKQLQKDIKVHKQITYKQNQQIQSLLQQLKKQRNFIDQLQLNHQNNIDTRHVIHQNNNQHIYQQKIIGLQNNILQKQAQYLLKLKQIDTIRTHLNNLQIQLNKLTQQKSQLINELHSTKINYQKVSLQLSSKVMQINQLINRPVEQKVYEVKIQKTIQKKQYILELQSKIRQLQHYIEQLKSTISSYTLQLKNKSIRQNQLVNKNSLLLKNIEQLKKYIQKRQQSVSWVVQRQIIKDVQISQHSSEQSKPKSYKVYVKNSAHSHSASDQQPEISLIKQKQYQHINISLGQKIGTLFQSQHHERNLQYDPNTYKINLELGQNSFNNITQNK